MHDPLFSDIWHFYHKNAWHFASNFSQFLNVGWLSYVDVHEDTRWKCVNDLQDGWQLCIKAALSGLTQFLATESPLKMMKNAFYFILKALGVLKTFKFLSLLFGHVEKRLDFNFKIYDVTT